MPPSRPALARLFEIVTLMHFRGAGRLTQEAIAEMCGCSVRQVGRDLAALKTTRVPIDRNRKQGYFLEDGYTPFKPQFTLHEALALLICREAVAGSGQMPFSHSAHTAYEKVSRLLPESLQAMIEEPAVQHVEGGKRNYADAPWGCLTNACAHSKTVEITYYAISSDSWSTRSIDPYRIVWLGGYCHLIAYCHLRKDIRNFSMDGITKAAETGDAFLPMPGFSLREHLSGASGPNIGAPIGIVVQFDNETARYARRRLWAFEHTLKDLPGGGLEMAATVRGLKDISRELLSWGRHAEVIEPPELRSQMAAEARAMVELYEQPK